MDAKQIRAALARDNREAGQLERKIALRNERIAAMALEIEQYEAKLAAIAARWNGHEGEGSEAE